MALAADGKTLATGDMAGTIRVWDMATGTERLSLKTDYNWVHLLELAPHGTLLAWAGLKTSRKEISTVRLWDVGERRERATLPIGVSLAYSPDGKTVAIGGYNSVKLWDVSGLSRRSQREVNPTSSGTRGKGKP
jgi:WD40 repeat protein